MIKIKMVDYSKEMHRGGGTDSEVNLKIGVEDDKKINEWLNEIRGNGKDINTMRFPVLVYEFSSCGDIGAVLEVKELTTGKTLDLTNISLW
jgi:hypothetical protein